MVQETKKRKLSVCAKYKLFDCNFYDYVPNKDGSDEEQADKEIPKFMIELYGIDETGKTCCVKVNNYKPFFYVKVGDDWDSSHVGD